MALQVPAESFSLCKLRSCNGSRSLCGTPCSLPDEAHLAHQHNGVDNTIVQ